MVVIGITATVLGLLLPAVQRVRETANRLKCQSHLRQIGVALHHFHATHKVFPASGWTMPGPGNPLGKFVGWRALTLPFYEQDNLHRLYDFTVHWWEGVNLQAAIQPIGLFVCPTTPQRVPVYFMPAKPPRPVITLSSPLAPTDYEAIMGVARSVDPQRYSLPSANRSVMFRNSRVRMMDILDGASQTIMVVECAGRPSVYRGRLWRPDLTNDQGQGWIDSEGAFSLDGSNEDGSLQGQGPTVTPRAINATNDNEPYSFHPGGANFLLADGHVQFIREHVPLPVFAALCTRNGGEVVSPADY
ncbi:MAG: hypothetical protein C4297_05310 [Gemmataceae bacterium]